jgi:hypothetical protein
VTDKIAQLSKIAMDYAAEQYGPQRAGEKVWDPLTYDRKFAELIVRECISYCGENLPQTVGGALLYHFNILAGADQMAGDGGYKEASLKSPEFLEIQARHHALYSKSESNR